jgi:competence protein ComGF
VSDEEFFLSLNLSKNELQAIVSLSEVAQKNVIVKHNYNLPKWKKERNDKRCDLRIF